MGVGGTSVAVGMGSVASGGATVAVGTGRVAVGGTVVGVDVGAGAVAVGGGLVGVGISVGTTVLVGRSVGVGIRFVGEGSTTGRGVGGRVGVGNISRWSRGTFSSPTRRSAGTSGGW